MITIKALWGMARPLIVVSVLLVYLLGNLVARGSGFSMDISAFLWGLAALLLVTLSIHYANEYADYPTDALTNRTPFSGGSGVLPRGEVSRTLALKAAWMSLSLGWILAMWGYQAGILKDITLILLAIGSLGGWMYSLPPLRLAWRGWGELDNAILGGIVLPAYGYSVQTGEVNAWLVLIFMPFTLLAFDNLLATTWADRRADAHVGKLTLATRWSPRRLRALYLLLAVASITLLILYSTTLLPRKVALSGVLVIPLVVWGSIDYTRRESPHASVFTMVSMLLFQITAWYITPLQ